MKYYETEAIELKDKLNDSFVKEVVAFLNSHNGIIYIGVSDNGEIVGVNNSDEVLRAISNIVVDSIAPDCKSFVKPSAVYEDGKIIVKVEVEKGNSLYYIKNKGRSESGCFIRLGTSCRGLSEQEIEERYLESLNVPDKSIVDISVLRTDLTFVKFKNYLSAKGIHINEDTFYKNFNLITKDGKFNILAEMLADENMNSIKVAVFKGKDKTEFIKRNEYGNTCLLYSYEQVLNYCEALNDTYVDLSYSPRKEKKMFNNEVLKEAWTNACVHNAWWEGNTPAIYWFEDRLEVVSYGGIPKSLTKEQFLQGSSDPVNKELMKIFLQCGIVEQSGHGVPLVVREYGEQAYKFDKNMITVVIPFDKNGFNKENTVEKSTVNSTVNSTVKLNKTEQSIIELIQENENITLKEIATRLNKTESLIKKSIKKLKEGNIIERFGSDKTGYWKIKN